MSSDELIVLNVGGVRHNTTLSTLRRFPHSMLAAMFGGSFTPSVLRDNDGYVFIDRDGSTFQHVLNFLRTSRLCLPQNFQDYELLEAEADYFQIPELIAASKEHQERNQKPVGSCSDTSLGTGFYLEILEFEETAYFYRFYMPPPSRSANNGAFKSGGLVITGHKDVLQTLPLSNATRLQVPGAGDSVSASSTPQQIAFNQAAAGAAGWDGVQQNNSADYPTLSVSNAEKMALFHHLAQNGWRLHNTAFSYSTDSDGSYIVHKYIWHLSTVL